MDEREVGQRKGAPGGETVKETEHGEPVPPCFIFIDKEGHWYHQGAEMIHREFIQLFYRNMELDPAGRYLITWGGTRCYVEVEDTAFVVKRVSLAREGGRQSSWFRITLSDDTEEALAPDTLHVGKGHVIYCRVKSSAFPARFNRAAYYQLAEHIEERNGAYFLPLDGRSYPVRATGP